MSSPDAPPQPNRLTLPAVMSAQLMLPMSIAGTAIALPAISRDLGTAPGPLQAVVNGFNIAFALCTVLWGVAADRLGHRAVFRSGAVLALVGSLASALSPHVLALDAARVVAGTGAAAVLTGGSSLLSALYTGPARRRAFAWFGTLNGLGLALGPSVSGLLVASTGWRGVFGAQVVALAGALALSSTLPRVASSPQPGRRLLDLSLLRHRRFLAMTLVPVAGAIGFVTLLTYLPNAFSAVLDMGTASAGALMLAMTLPVLVAPMVVGRALARSWVTPPQVIAAGLGCFVVAHLGLLQLGPTSQPWQLLGWLVAGGLGFGLTVGMVDDEALSAVPAERAGTAAGLLNLARIGSEAVAVAAYAAVLAALVTRQVPGRALAERVAAGGQGRPDAYADALHVVVLGCAVLVLLLGLAIAALLRRPATSRATAPDPAGCATAS